MSDLMFLDTETTDKDETARLVQLCFKINNQEPTTLLVKPPVPISFEAMATHHITETDVEGCVPFDQLGFKEHLQEKLDTHIMVAHNAVFDKTILEREGLKISKFICTLKVAQNLLDEPSYKLQYLRYKYGLDQTSRAHDAEGDVTVLTKLFNFLCRLWQEKNRNDYMGYIDAFLKMSSEPVLLRRIGFGKHRGTLFSEVPKDYLLWLAEQPNNNPDLVHTIKYYSQHAI